MNSATIQSVTAREILDSRGNPTVEVDVRLHDGTLRKFTIEELLTLSSFPPDFKWPAGSSYSEQLARIGNAVPPLMMFHLASAIRDALQRTR